MSVSKSSLVFLLFVFSTMTGISYASNHANKVIWTAVFSNFTPIKKGTTVSYCKSHTPSVIVITIKQITSKEGINGLNGVNIRYLSYKAPFYGPCL